MEPLIAYCGLVCSDCPAYIATQADDRGELERVVAMWREEYGAPDMTVASIICDGCNVAGRKCGHCAECDIRACAVALNVANCAHCDDYDRPGGCDKLEGLLSAVPQARTLLDGIRAGLVA